MTTNINASAAGLIQTVDVSGNLQLQTANVAAITIDLNQNVTFNGTGAITLPSGDSSQRPATAANGAIRYNTTLNSIEGLVVGNWSPIKTFDRIVADYLVVAGGAGGGGGNYHGGGGGAGGLIVGSGLVLSPGTSYAITVGAGGAGGGATLRGTNGSNSVFSAYTAIGGGGGGNYSQSGGGASGGSGGGGPGSSSASNAGGAGTSGQGNAGGNGYNGAPNYGGGGGGGAGAVGASGTSTTGGNGGAGLASTITGSSVTYAGGGGGSSYAGGTPGTGGSGGGGNGTTSGNATDGQANTGGGGGGSERSGNLTGGAGGSGIVIVSYPSTIQLATGGNITSYTSGSTTYQVHKFTSSGALTTISNPTYQVNINMWGGGGAGGTVGGWNYGSVGGAGGAASATWNLSPGTAYNIVVGGPGIINSYNTGAAGGGAPASLNGADNRYGGGSGGYSGIFLNLGISQATALLIAGGGGGGGSGYNTGSGNWGGAGGGTTGENGYSPYNSAYGGKGGTQSAAGATSPSYSANETAQQGALQGGSPTTNAYGGAGGGGYWGGSGGGYDSGTPTMGGGGGGSGYIAPNTFVAATLYQGLSTVPGDSTNSLRGTYGNAGAYQGNGTGGAVIIWYAGSQKGSGGTVTTSGGYTYHTFTGAGNFIA